LEEKVTPVRPGPIVRFRLFALAMLLAVGTVSARETFEDRSVGEVEFTANNRTHDFNVSVGGEEWENDIYSTRFGLSVLGVKKEQGIYGAAYGGLRLSVPFVVSPFVGFNLVIGRGYDRDSEKRYDRDHGKTNGTNGDRGPYGYIVACYPEAGVRFWLGQRSSLVGSVRYFVSSTGRSNDCFMYGGSLTVRY
jgi:hypothetical protein